MWVEGGSEAQAHEARGHQEGRWCRSSRTQQAPPCEQCPHTGGHTPSRGTHRWGCAVTCSHSTG